jgi:hypothetical protein
MTIHILKENVLSNNTLVLSSENKVFKGGYVAIINEYVYQNAWSDRVTVKRFRNQTRLEKYLSKNYPEFYISFHA